MTPEHMVLQMTDGSQFDAIVKVEKDGLHIEAGGFLALTFVVRPESARQVAHRILEMLTDAVETGTLKHSGG
jgi:hypothetical protein